MDELGADTDRYRQEVEDPPLEMYSDDNAGPMPEDSCRGDSSDGKINGFEDMETVAVDSDLLHDPVHDSLEIAAAETVEENGEGVKPTQNGIKVAKKPTGSGSTSSKTLGRSSTSLKKSPATGSTAPARTFLKSSSAAAAARRHEPNGNGVHSPAISSSAKSNASASAPSTPRASSSSTSTPNKSTTSSVQKRSPSEAPATPTSRRSSISSTTPSTDSSRRASLSALPSRSAPSTAELRKWSTSPSPKIKSTSTTPGRITNLSLHSQSSLSKSTDFLRRSIVPKSPATPNSKSPAAAAAAKSSKFGSPSSKPQGSSFSTSSTSLRSQAENGSPTSSVSSISKRSSSMGTPNSKRSPRTFESPTISSRSMSSEKSLLSSERPQGMLSKRKSLTPEPRDTRLITLPPVDVKAGDDVRLDLRGQKVRSLDCNLVHLTPKLEFVYLRDNKLSSMNGVEILKRVKVLDLSFNEFKGGCFEPLSNCKALQQLYLAGNQITSLSGLPTLPNLEFLSVAQNKLKSLAMATQPRLQVLAASKNRISTLKGFPQLPALEHLRLEENPILEVPHLEAASIILIGPTLKKFNDRDLSMEEQELSRQYPAPTALCIREGWEFCSPDDAAESSTQFLMSQWKDQLPPGFTLVKATIDRPFEEDPCYCDFLFRQVDDGDDELKLHLQWYIGGQTPIDFVPIEGATTKMYWPKHEDVGRCLKVECAPAIGDEQYPPVSAISFPIAPGTGCPKVLSVQVEGEPVEGNFVKGSAEVAWCGGTPGTGLVSWLRKAENKSPVAIIGAEDYSYQLTVDDVGTSLLFMYTPVTEEGSRGESHYAMSPLVQAAPPSVSNVQIIGEAVEGNILRGSGKYFGGREGASSFQWLREDQDTGDFNLVSKGSREYLLTDEDVGLKIMFIYSPVNATGHFGDPVSTVTSKVLLAPPRVVQLRLVGEIREGNKVVVSCMFIGGVEGPSRVQWFKSSSRSIEGSNLDAISTSKIAKGFRIPVAAVDHYLVAQYTPVRSDGESGEAAYVVSDAPVDRLPPSLNFLSITGELFEGEILTASYGYVGGYEGVSEYNWYLHENKYDEGTLIPTSAGQLQYQITKEAVYKFVSFSCIPVRDDGVVGDELSTMSEEPINPGSPKLTSFQIIGEAKEGSELRIERTYWGGIEGDSKLQWFLTSPDGTQRELKWASGATYTVRSDDIDGLICCSCEPVREDGARGPTAVSQLIGPVAPASPTCDSLEILGKAVEGERLQYRATYRGGKQGHCEHEWWRSTSEQDLYLGNDEHLALSADDVGCRIKLVFVPVRSDGCIGDPVIVTTSTVVDAEPEGKYLAIHDCHEDVEVVPQTIYFGGHEGESHFMWYRTSRKQEDNILPVDSEFLSHSLTYKPTLEDVGTYLILQWLPIRKDGKRGNRILCYSRGPVSPAPPAVRNVSLKEVSAGTFVGSGNYYGGREGESQMSWYRESPNGTTCLIHNALSNKYISTEDDYTCRVIFGYTPVRDDDAVGDLVFSEPSQVIYPEIPRVQKLVLSGKVIEGETLTALEFMPKGEAQQHVWDKYKKEVKYNWSRSSEAASVKEFEAIYQQRACTYKVRLEDVGYCLCCECTIYDVFGRCGEAVTSITQPVIAGIPRIDKLEIEGRGYHTNLYAVRGTYFGGREGKSSIQWFRAMAGSPDLIPIPGETGRMYEANVDDVGYRLVAVYTPVRDDGVEGNPSSASTEPIEVESEVSKEVKQKLELGAVKFEVLRDRDRSPLKTQQQQGLGSLERRILDVNRKRVKVVKPGSKTSFQSTEIRGTYAPPFHVELFRNDQHRLKVVMDSENEVDVIVRSRHIRDVIALVIRGLAQRFNSTPLNLLLKM